jgi:hypothetical protein
MNSQSDLMEKAIRNLGWRNKVRCGERVVQIAYLVRENGWRPLKAEWWRGKEVYVIGVAQNGDFILRHCDGSVRLWEHNSKSDSIIAPSVREFVLRIEE